MKRALIFAGTVALSLGALASPAGARPRGIGRIGPYDYCSAACVEGRAPVQRGLYAVQMPAHTSTRLHASRR